MYANITIILFIQNLVEWINDVLADRRVVVKCIEEDLNDGQVLAMLVGKIEDILTFHLCVTKGSCGITAFQCRPSSKYTLYI